MKIIEIDIFDLMYDKFKFDKTKPIRLFEAFSGIGTQNMALKRLSKELGFELEVVGISEVDEYAIRSYEAIHGETLNYGGIGSFDTLPNDIDIATWSFPCQDISLAGKQQGMVEGSRSNYGYQFLDTVERTERKPKVLLMENVRALFSEKFRDDWREIQLRLERMGYKNYADTLIATDYGIPQTRDRVFIVSILGDYSYTFPKPFELKTRLKDYLENDVDEKYFLSDKMLKGMMTTKFNQYSLENQLLDNEGVAKTILARFEGAPQVIAIPEATIKGYTLAKDGDLRIRKLTPLEAWRLMGIDDEDFYKVQSIGTSDSQLYKQAGNAIVVDVLYYIFKEMVV